MENNSVLSKKQINDFHKNGYLVVPRFINPEDCANLIKRAELLVENYILPQHKTIFSTKHPKHTKDQYFLASASNIHFFFEEEAFNYAGELKFSKHLCINKIGHALHCLDDVFSRFSQDEKIIRLTCDLKINNPLLIQSMYIFKQPQIGGEVTCHQDSTFIYSDFQTVTGLWFALEDATIQNGCLWVIPGGHHSALKERFKRTNENKTFMEVYDCTPWDLSTMIPLEVERGSLILLHGLLPHMSQENTSFTSRHAYTLHLLSGDYPYSKENWLQRPEDFPFTGFSKIKHENAD